MSSFSFLVFVCVPIVLLAVLIQIVDLIVGTPPDPSKQLRYIHASGWDDPVIYPDEPIYTPPEADEPQGTVVNNTSSQTAEQPSPDETRTV
jgi:hypothetical protein